MDVSSDLKALHADAALALREKIAERAELKAKFKESVEDIIVIEEAHHVLLKHPAQQTEPITDVLLREVRELGEAVITIDHEPLATD